MQRVKYQRLVNPGSEGRITSHIRKVAERVKASGVVLGIGDDCAIVRPRGAAEDLLLTSDLLIEDVHFRQSTHRPEDIGWKTLARGLSDIASMGGDPRWCVVSLAVSCDCDKSWIDRFYRGFLQLARREGAALVGGDLARADHVVCDIMVCGTVPRGKALRRDRARAGDAVYVSGRLGGSALGLSQSGAARRRHLRPEPRVTLGRFLRGRATAAMDLSDGLSLDLERLALASGLAAEITVPPRFRGATLEQALHGGEDYELLFCAPASRRLPADFEGIPLTRIGTMRKGRPGLVLLDGAPLAPLGYDHFRGV
ncbi:MAG TPA: thiamine-phosphate kinase [Methylocystis sp.]|nr:thiamine-phosphate kinase [Methylocystis sp.]